MHCNKLAELFVPVKERELNDPEKVILILRDDVKLLCNVLTQSAEGGKGDSFLVGNDENNVALFGSGLLCDCGHFRLAHELCKGGGNRTVFGISYPGDALCADSLDKLGQLVKLFSGEDRIGVLCGDSANSCAALHGVREHTEAAVPDLIGKVKNFHLVAGIGLIGTVTLHSLFIGQARKLFVDFNAESLFEQLLHEAFDH